MKNEKTIPVIILILFAFFFIYLLRKANLEKDDIENNLFTTVAYVSNFSKNRTISNYHYYYYYNGRKYTDIENLGGYDEEQCIGKYFKVSISREHPEYSLINLTEEVTDKLMIAEAGF